MIQAEPPPTMKGAQYRFLWRIARGGMAELFVGEAASAGGVSRRVALKRILPKHAVDEEYLDMFMEEARLGLLLQHPNIVQTYDVVQSGDEFVIVMELLEGADLYQLKRKLRAAQKWLTLSQVLYIATSLLNALHYAHERSGTDGKPLGIVHRDVSPQNIFLTYDGSVKLLDFGIAKTMGAQEVRTESGILKGKVRYMSPEQCTGQAVDRRSDVYAVGVVLYQLLTGQVPHRGKTPIATMRAILEDAATPLHEMDTRLDAELSQLVLKAIAKLPEDRYTSAREMQLALQGYIDAHRLFVTAPAMAELVEGALGPRGTLEPIDHSEPGHTISSLPRERTPSNPQSNPSSLRPRVGGQILFESAAATVRRVGQTTVLELTGAIDERFDRSPFSGLLRGEVILDSSGVTRITSFGIRQLLTLFTEMHGYVNAVYHVRCSVQWMLQVAMIRNLLGGGKVLSFYAPYIDGADGRTFARLFQGAEAEDAVRRRRLPNVPSPSDPSRPAAFDDDPDVYLNFAPDLLAVPPRHLVPVLQFLDDQKKTPLDVELVVTDEGSELHIRTSLREERWRRAVRGLEGAVSIDLTAAPASSANEISRFLDALEAVSDDLSEVRFLGVPVLLVSQLSAYPLLQQISRVDSVQVACRCRGCGLDRRVCMPWTETNPGGVQRVGNCPQCGDVLSPVSELTNAASWGQTPVPAPLDRPRNQTPTSFETRTELPHNFEPEWDPSGAQHTLASRSSEPSLVHAHVEVPKAVGFVFAAAFGVVLLALAIAVYLFFFLGDSQ
jgi:serine/threonine protein kinase